MSEASASAANFPSNFNHSASQSFLRNAPQHSQSIASLLGRAEKFLQHLGSDAASPQLRREFASIAQESNPDALGQMLLVFADRLLEANHPSAAAEIYQSLATAPVLSETLRENARRLICILEGGGNTGEQIARLLPRLRDETISFHSLASFAGAGLVGKLSYAGIFSKLSNSGRLLAFTGRTGAQVIAGLGSLALEAPIFAALSSTFGGNPLTGSEIGAAMLFLGTIRGSQALARLGMDGNSAVVAGSSFLGILGANHLLRAWELKPRIPGESLLLDSFTSLLQFMISDRTLNSLLGSRYHDFLRETDLRTASLRPEFGTGQPNFGLKFATSPATRLPAAKPTAETPQAPTLMMASSLVEIGGVHELPAVKQSELVRNKEISAEELAKSYLEKIEAKNPELTAFVQVMRRSAIRQARSLDRSTERNAPFFGVPIGIKDLNFVRGSFTRFGSRTFKYFYTPFDDRMVKQLKLGGFVILGKLATAEFGAMPVTEPPIHAPTRNPWNLALTAGGSSGGSGAAVASGMIPIAQGSDGAGSIRIPASFNHLYGFKPSRDLVPDPYGRDHPRRLSVVGPLARSVEDAAAMLDVMAGISVAFPAKQLLLSRSRLVDSLQDTLPPLQIRLALQSPLTPTHPEIAEAVTGVAKALEGLGHRVEPIAPFQAEVEEFLPLWQKLLGSAPVPFASLLSPVPRWLRAAGRQLNFEDVNRQHDLLDQRIRKWFGNANIVLSPTVAIPPPAIGALERATPEATFHQAAALGAFTALYNVSGQPAASIPIGLTSSGLPIGLQIAGRDLQDGLVLALSRQIEEMMPWSHRRAP